MATTDGMRAEIDDEGRQCGLRVLAADEDKEALESTAAVLRALGHDVVALAVRVPEAAARIAAEDPDLAVVVVHHDREHALELIAELSSYVSGPVIAIVDEEDTDFLATAASHGLFAYARLETPQEVQGAIELAMARHADVSELSEQVSRLEAAIERRATIERAKGILMERHDVGEREAFELLRRNARASNRRVTDLATSVIESRALLPDHGGADGRPGATRAGSAPAATSTGRAAQGR